MRGLADAGAMDVKHAIMWILLVFGAVRCQFNPPTIPSDMPVFFSVLENSTIGTEVFLLRANDQNIAVTLTFSISTPDTATLVRLDPTIRDNSLGLWTCKVFLNAALDRDRSPSSRHLYFSVTDGQSTVQIRIVMIIQDVNDNPPTFVGLPYRQSIPENLPVGSSVFTVTATDPDSNNGPYIFYSMKSTATDYDETFYLNTTTGRITLAKPLDYETHSFFNFNVSAKDGGDPPCPGETCQCRGTPDVCNPGPAELFITIIDVQDTPPIFVRLPYIKSVPENESIGFSILTVVATDGDRGISEPNDIRYSFTGGDFYNFSINEINGTISVNGTLDADVDEIRSKGGLFVFTVTATEVPRPGFPSIPNPNNQSSTQVSITVTDVNDNPPVFLSNGLPFSDFTANVLENTPGGVPVKASSIIEVYDRDQGSNSRFWVYLEKDGSPYHDFELLPQQYSLIQGRSTVTIIVANSSALDYETTQEITFKLIARENNSNANIPTSSEITVTININDTNDNSPYFPEQPTIFNVTENEDIGHVITTVTASDLDSGKFGEISFSLEDGGENGDFNISKQGQITVAKWLDREITPFYSLIVVAEDNPLSPADQRRSTRRFQIRVLDDNDNAPIWQQDTQNIQVLKTMPVGTKLIEMRATDADQGINAEIVYSIAPGTNGSNLFEAITSGAVAEIKINQSLIGNTGVRLVHVVATDKGTPSKSSMMNLYIKVDDVNQHKPVFIKPNESSSEIPQITVEEEQEPGSVLYTLEATDNDEGENGQVLYFMNLPLGDYDYFKVNSTNGALYSRQRLDRESKDIFEIQVKAEDTGKPVSLSTIITLRIRLQDINDNEPSYKNVPMPQVLHVTEERQPEYIGQIKPAFDPDVLYNRTCYYIHGSKNISDIHLDKMTGNLTLIKKVDREVTESVNLVIKASENCSLDSFFFIYGQNSSLVPVPASLQDPPVDYNSSDYSLLWVKIMVDDINDSPPQFTIHELLASIIYDVDIGTEVMSLAMSINDEDTPANSKNKFKSLSITPVLEIGESLDTTREPFLVSENGSITTNIRFRSDLLGYFLLKVLAYDDDGLNDTSEIKVYLIANLQRIKLVFNKLPNQVEEMKSSFFEQLSNILNVDLIVDKIQSHTNSDGTRDPSKTDAFIHGRYRSTGKIVPASGLWQMFDVNQAARTFMLNNGVIAAQPLTEQKTDDTAEVERRIFAIIIAVLSVVAITLVLVLIHLVRLYRRRLRAATTMAYVAPNEKAMLDHPGTNKYFAAENPLFGKEMKQLPMDDDKISTNSLDINEVDKQPIKSIDPSEEQEMVMNIADSNGEDQTQNLNHYSHLDEVLQAYSNMAYKNEENEDSYSTAVRGAGGRTINGRSYSSSPYTLSFISGMRPNVSESVTHFTDEVISNDSGLADTNLRHTDI